MRAILDFSINWLNVHYNMIPEGYLSKPFVAICFLAFVLGAIPKSWEKTRVIKVTVFQDVRDILQTMSTWGLLIPIGLVAMLFGGVFFNKTDFPNINAFCFVFLGIIPMIGVFCYSFYKTYKINNNSVWKAILAFVLKHSLVLGFLLALKSIFSRSKQKDGTPVPFDQHMIDIVEGIAFAISILFIIRIVTDDKDSVTEYAEDLKDKLMSKYHTLAIGGDPMAKFVRKGAMISSSTKSIGTRRVG